jgi:hypothetical protein
MAMGQAAGLAAAMAVESGETLRAIDVPTLQDRLRALGAVLPEPAGRHLEAVAR